MAKIRGSFLSILCKNFDLLACHQLCMCHTRCRKAGKLWIILSYLKQYTQSYMLGRKWALQFSYLAASKLGRTGPLGMKDRN